MTLIRSFHVAGFDFLSRIFLLEFLGNKTFTLKKIMTKTKRKENECLP
jgi:hypothetical protein